jgi:protein SCO1
MMRSQVRLGITTIVAGSLWAVVAVVCGAGPAAAGAESRWGAGYFPNVTLTTQDGVRVRFYDDLIKDKIVAINLIYTTCKYACPLETARLAQVQAILGDRMGRDVFFYSITIDPDHDTPAVLKEYAEKYHAGPGWLFLTGTAADIELIGRKLGLYSEPNPANQDGHTPSLVVGNSATGQWMRNSALDNARFLATTIGSWMGNWRDARPGRSYVEATPLVIDAGRYGFARHCAPCHSIGDGRKIGPDLAGVTKARDRWWLERFIVSPQRLLAEGDPTAVALFEKYKPLQMPSLDLSAKDAAAIVDYIDARSAALDPPAVAAEAGASPPAAARQAPDFDVTLVLGAYLRIQAALYDDSLAGAAAGARQVVAAVAKVGADAGAAREASAALAAATTLQGARTAFGALTAAIMSAAKASNANLGADVRLAYCPMARKYWLQAGTAVRNPFYGKAMPDCGRIVEAIPDGARQGWKP